MYTCRTGRHVKLYCLALSPYGKVTVSESADGMVRK